LSFVVFLYLCPSNRRSPIRQSPKVCAIADTCGQSGGSATIVRQGDGHGAKAVPANGFALQFIASNDNFTRILKKRHVAANRIFIEVSGAQKSQGLKPFHDDTLWLISNSHLNVTNKSRRWRLGEWPP